MEKCAMLITRSGKKITEGLELSNLEKIRMVGEKETYKNLGILEADTIKQAGNYNFKDYEKKHAISSRKE